MRQEGFSHRSKFFVAIVAMVIASFAMQPVAEAQITSTRDASAAFIKEVTFFASGSRTGPGNSGSPVDLSAYASGVILVNTTVAGTTMTVSFENCLDSGTTKCGIHTVDHGDHRHRLTVIKVDHFGRYGRVSFTSTGAFTYEAYGAFKPTS
jgi:hypothetical protein